MICRALLPDRQRVYWQSGPLAASKPQPAVSSDVAVQQKSRKADPDGILSQLFSTEPVL